MTTARRNSTENYLKSLYNTSLQRCYFGFCLLFCPFLSKIKPSKRWKLVRATFNCPRPELKTRTKKGRLKTSAHVSHSPNTQPFVAVSYCSNSERISSLLRLIASAKNHHEQQRKGLLSIAKQTRSLPWGSDRRHQQIKHGARGSAGVVGHESGNHRRSCGHFRNGQLCNSCSRLVPGKSSDGSRNCGPLRCWFGLARRSARYRWGCEIFEGKRWVHFRNTAIRSVFP